MTTFPGKENQLGEYKGQPMSDLPISYQPIRFQLLVHQKKNPNRQHLHFCQFRDDLGIESKNVFSLSLIQIETSMEGSRILVTGLPKGINKSDLIIYFQSARDSGGGDVRKIEIEGKQAIVTFEDVKGMYQFIREGRVSLIYLPRLIKSTWRCLH